MGRDIFYDLEMIEQQCHTLRTLFPDLSPRYVAGQGPDHGAQAFIVGEAPGAQEEMTGRPFAGPSGFMLRQLMRMADLEPADCWITNVVKYRPPRNRTPTAAEINAFRSLLHEEWKVVGKPRLIIPIGTVAMKALTRKTSVLAYAGKPIVKKRVVIFPQLHPAFGLRGTNTVKEQIERDWEVLGEWRAENP